MDVNLLFAVGLRSSLFDFQLLYANYRSCSVDDDCRSMNLEDIARISGFSRSTVSRVLNNDPNVRDSTRQRVREVIHTTNYSPNLAARGLAAGRTYILGMVIPRSIAAVFGDPYSPILIRGVAAACNALDYSIMLWLADQEFERHKIHRILDSGLVDGILVTAATEDDPVVTALCDSDMPLVTIGRLPNLDEISYVDVDNKQGALDAVTHLLRLGNRRVACIGSPLNTGVGLDRMAGYLAALERRGILVEAELIVEGDFSEMSGYAAMQRLLSHAPDAVFAFSDSMALGALRALREANMRVPEEVAVVGFDDFPPAAQSVPPLTTVRQPTERTGRMAVELLTDIIERPSESCQRVILPTELVVRQSCGLA